MTELSVFSLNFFGLYGFSPKRRERVSALGRHLRESTYDIVLLQEVWTQEDYETLKKELKSGGPFGFSHYFSNGIIGSGTCIFTRERIRFTAFHSFGLNGYPQCINHGDWFAAKGLGLAILDIGGFEVHVYVSHYHAEYQDTYMGHQVIQALESAQWIKLTSISADLTIYTGDFNMEPNTVPIRLLKNIGHLKDSWEEVHGSDVVGSTCETPYNSFTPDSRKEACPQGKRIDYIMHRSGAETESEAVAVLLPLSKRVPGQNYSFSDHEAIEARIRIKRHKEMSNLNTYKKSLSDHNLSKRLDVVSEALGVIRQSEAVVATNGFKYLGIALSLLALLLLSLVPSYMDNPPLERLDLALFLPRLIISMIMSFYLIMGTVFTKRELNELKSTRSSLEVIHTMDNIDNNSWDLLDDQ